MMDIEQIRNNIKKLTENTERMNSAILPKSIVDDWIEYEWGKMKFTSTEEDMQNGLMKAEIVLYQRVYHINLMENNN